MASINKKKVSESVYTHGGSRAYKLPPKLELKRAVMACLLWEDQFYEDGVSIAERIKDLIAKTSPENCMEIAIEARSKMNLRHVPLLIAREMARLPKHKALVSLTLAQIIQRPDELTEFLALYWKDGKEKISAQVKKGLAKAFTKFSEYQLAKYNRDNAIKLKDVLFLCHAKPKDKEQEAVWKKLINNELKTPDTWEVNLSAGKDKKETWERLLAEGKIGGLALLRNLRNMNDVNVDKKLVSQSLEKMKTDRILPYRFISASIHAPDFEPSLEIAMFNGLNQKPKMKGKTILIVDVSGSMYSSKVSSKSEMNRAKAACSLAIFIRELCEEPVIYATAGSDSKRIHETSKVPPRRGFALSDAIYKMCAPLGGGGIFLSQVMSFVKDKEKSADRIIVITDEQDCDPNNNPQNADTFGDKNYLINVASAKNGIGYGKWIHVDGFSEAIIDYIYEYENSFSQQR